MPSPPPAEITLTTDAEVAVPYGAATLVLAANSNAVFRQVHPLDVRVAWLGFDSSVLPQTGMLITLLTPFLERQISTFTAVRTGAIYVAHNFVNRTIMVKVLEGESA